MIENEFDRVIQDLMKDAEEPVSPAVWESVSAALDKAAPKRVVPLWLWRASAAVATAAAAIAAILLVQSPKKSPLPASPVAVVEQPAAEPVPSRNADVPESTVPASIAEQAERVRTREAFLPAAQRPKLTPQAMQETVVPTETRQPIAPVAVPLTPADDSRRESVTSDQGALNQLLFEDHSYRPGRRFSVSASGNMQDSHRGDARTTTNLRRVAAQEPTIPTITEGPEFNFTPPFSIGASFRYDFNDRFGIGTGLFYTYLGRSFMGTYYRFDDAYNAQPPISGDVDNQQHWLGVPFTGYLNLVKTGSFTAYLYAGGAIEKMISNKYVIHYPEDGKDYHYNKALPYGFQSSARLGFGLEYRLTPQWSLYMDPSVRYYFNNRQPRSIRTIQPLRFDIEIGARFTL